MRQVKVDWSDQMNMWGQLNHIGKHFWQDLTERKTVFKTDLRRSDCFCAEELNNLKTAVERIEKQDAKNL